MTYDLGPTSRPAPSQLDEIQAQADIQATYEKAGLDTARTLLRNVLAVYLLLLCPAAVIAAYGLLFRLLW